MATRVANSSSSCIDNIFTDMKYSDVKLTEIVKSDHFGQSISVEISSGGKNGDNTFIYRRRFNDNNMKSFCNAIRACQSLKVNDCSEVMFKKFFENLVLNLNSYMPVKKINCKQNKSFKGWAKPGILISRKRLFDLYRVKERDNSRTTKDFVSTYSRVFGRVCREAKQMYIRNKIESSNNIITTTWKVIKEETGKTWEYNES
jgi:hypothetical protein